MKTKKKKKKTTNENKMTEWVNIENSSTSWYIMNDPIRTKPKTVKHLEIHLVKNVQHPWKENHKRS